MASVDTLDALAMATAVRRREISPSELVRASLARVALADGDGQLGAFVTVTAEAAQDAAKQADDEVVALARMGALDELPPLHGVPIGIKDLSDTAGVPTRYGSAAFADHVPAADAFVVTALRAAGTIMIGKTNTPELGTPCYTESAVAPPARTPWDLTRSAGGSSGGSGAAVAAGLVPFAHGSDGGGSIRIPASACGIVGLKVSRGRVSNGPVGGDLTGLSWHGPMARTVADTAALLDVMAGYRPGDPHWAPPLPGGATFRRAAENGAAEIGAGTCAPAARLRIARSLDNVLGAPVHPDCVAAWESASAALAELGHEVVDLSLPSLLAQSPLDSFLVLWTSSAASTPVPAEREHLLTPLTRYLRERGRGHAATDYLQALAALQVASRRFVAATYDFDAVLTPTLAQPPSLVGELRNDDDPAADVAAQSMFTPYTSLFNVTGQPAISLPLHWTADGLPIGVQFAGRPGDEAGLLRLAAQLEQARPWGDRHPPGW